MRFFSPLLCVLVSTSFIRHAHTVVLCNLLASYGAGRFQFRNTGIKCLTTDLVRRDWDIVEHSSTRSVLLILIYWARLVLQQTQKNKRMIMYRYQYAAEYHNIKTANNSSKMFRYSELQQKRFKIAFMTKWREVKLWKCLLTFSSEKFVFSLLSKTVNIKIYTVSYRLVLLMWNLSCHP